MIRKAVIPAAGLGTRMLPLTKTQPKEMLPLADKPCIQFIVEELAAAGVDQILIITGHSKRAIEDHFDKDHELNRVLASSGQDELLSRLSFEDMAVQFFFTRQSNPRGLGDAILHARHFVNGDPFIVALGDSVITSAEHTPLLRRMLDLHDDHPDSLVLGTREVPPDQVSRYGIVKPGQSIAPGLVTIDDVIEKPSASQAPSTLAFAARYVLPAGIIDALERTPPGRGGEIQLTDAIRLLLREQVPGYALSLTPREKRYDIGSMNAYYEAFLDFALADERYGYQLRQYLVRKLNLQEDIRL